MVAAAYKAGTVWADIVPAIKGIDKELRNGFSTPVEKAANSARGTISKSIDAGAKDGTTKVAGTFNQGFRGQGEKIGTALGNDLADGLSKSIPALRVQAKQAGDAVAKANDVVQASGEKLRAARAKEEQTASEVERAERNLADARASGNQTAIAQREQQLTDATKRAATAAKDADTAATTYQKSLSEQRSAAARAEEAQGALADASARAAEKQRAAAAASVEAARKAQEQSTVLGRMKTTIGGWGDSIASTGSSIAQRLTSTLGPAASKIGGFFSAAKSKVSGALSGIGSAIGTLGGVVASVAAAGIGLVATKVMSLVPAAIQASDATNKFASTLAFADVGTAQIEELKKSTQAYADATVYELGDIQSMTAQLASNGVDDYAKLAEAAGNLNAVAGGNADTYKAVGLVMTQTAGAGKLVTENWNQLTDAIPGASGKLQEAMRKNGAYTGNFRDAMAKGEITAEEFNTAVMQLGMTDVAKEAATSTSTIEGAMGNLDASITGGLMKSVDKLKPALTTAINGAAEAISPFFDWLATQAEKVAPLVERIGSGLSKLSEGGSGLGGVLSGILPVAGALSGPVGKSVATFLERLPLVGARMGGAVRAVSGPIGFIISLVISMITNSKKLRDALGGAFSRIGESLKSLLPAGEAAGGIFDQIGKLAGWLGDALAPVVTGLGEVVAWLIELTGSGLSKAFDWLNTGIQAASAWITDSLLPGIESVWNILTKGDFDGNLFGLSEDSPVVDVLFRIRDAAMSVSEWFTGTLIPGIKAAWDLLTTGDFTGGGVLFGLSEDSPVVGVLLNIRDIIGMVGDTATQVWNGIIMPVLQSVGSIIAGVWEGYIKPAFDLIVMYVRDVIAPLIGWFWNNIWSPAITAIGAVVGFVFGGIIVPALKAVWWFISNVLAPVISWLYTNIVAPAFSAIGTVIKITGTAISIILQGLIWVIKQVGGWFSRLYDTYVRPAFDSVRSKIDTVVGFLRRTVFPPLEKAVSGMGKGFQSFKDTVGSAMDGIRAAAAKPINFVIRTVYTGGIKKAFDTIAEKIGIKTRMPDVKPISGYATGGILPGYTPGRDVHRFVSPTGGTLLLSGGEGIIRPDSLRALGGKRWLDAVNASRGRGVATVGDVGSVARFAEGGIWGKVKDFASGAWSTATNAASFVADVVSNPGEAISKLVRAPADALLSTLDNSMWGQIAKGIPSMLWDGITGLFTKKVDAIGGGGSALVSAARKAIGVPYVWGGSSIPPGLDCSGLVYWAYQQLGKNVPRLTAAGYQSAAKSIPYNQKKPGDLLFWGNPAYHVAIVSGGGRMVEEPRPGLSGRETAIWGAPTAGRLYDNGGYIPPGVSTVVNKTGRPEPVLTDNQWAAIKNDNGTRGDGRTYIATESIEELREAVREGADAGVAGRIGSSSRQNVRAVMGV